MKCPYCGVENAESAIKCASCHALLKTDNEEILDAISAAPVATTVGAAQAQAQPQTTPTPVVEAEVSEKPNMTEQFIKEREAERAARPERPVYQAPVSSADLQPNDKAWGILSYIFILVSMIVYFTKKDTMSHFLKTHLNQAIVIHIIAYIANFVGRFIPIVGQVLNMATFIAFIMGVYYVATGQDKEIPYIGEFKIF